MERKSKLYIETVNGRSEAEIAGTPAEIMFNWAALTNQIGLKLHLTPIQLAFMLPDLIANYKRTIRETVEFDAAAVRHKQNGGQP